MRWLFISLASSALASCAAVSPSSLPMMHEPIARMAVGSGSVAALAGAGGGLALNSVAGGEARLSVQATRTFAVEVSGGGGAQVAMNQALVSDAPTVLFFGRTGVRWQPGGRDRFALRAGVGGGGSDSGVAYGNADLGVGFGRTYDGWVRPYAGFSLGVSVPFAPGPTIQHSFPETGAMLPLRAALWVGAGAGLTFRVVERFELGAEVTANVGAAPGDSGGFIFTGTLLARMFLGAFERSP